MSSNGKARSPGTGGCLICGRPQEDRFRPFCSRRCADIDLHRWLSEVYVVPAIEAEGDDGDDLASNNAARDE